MPERFGDEAIVPPYYVGDYPPADHPSRPPLAGRVYVSDRTTRHDGKDAKFRQAQVIGLIDGAVLNLDHVGTILSNLIHQEESLEVLELDVPRALAAIKRARHHLAHVNGDLLLAAKQAEALAREAVK